MRFTLRSAKKSLSFRLLKYKHFGERQRPLFSFSSTALLPITSNGVVKLSALACFCLLQPGLSVGLFNGHSRFRGLNDSSWSASHVLPFSTRSVGASIPADDFIFDKGYRNAKQKSRAILIETNSRNFTEIVRIQSTILLYCNSLNDTK